MAKKQNRTKESEVKETKETAPVNEERPTNPDAITIEEFKANCHYRDNVIVAGFICWIKGKEPEPIMHTLKEYNELLEQFKNEPVK